MSRYVSSVELLERCRQGELVAIGRLISRAEAGAHEARDALAQAYRSAGGAHTIGITGVPGSGKSTLVAKLVRALRVTGVRVAVLAIDPSSPYTGGSILGDRIRMTDLVTDPGVYIRSMATHGATGGMARGALEAADVLDIAGYHTIVIETVGVGQDEVEIAQATHTTVVVSAPGLGDDIQAVKAGILEIADIHVVSKCDRADANRTMTDLKQMLTLGLHDAAAVQWVTPVLGTSAVTGEGIDALMATLALHRQTFSGTAAGEARRRRVAQFRLAKAAEDLLLERFRADAGGAINDLVPRVAQRETDPYGAARQVIACVAT
jgi:LAO/AO transport system kinase